MERKPLQIVHYPHPGLRHPARPVRRVDADLAGIVREMFDLMYAFKGIGLAATQVGLPLRLFIANPAGQPGEGTEYVFINPVLSRPKGNEEAEEGCLSFPELYGPVKRPKQITVNAYNLQGVEIKAELNGMLARVVQHEFDHLDSVLYMDRMSATARAVVQPTLEEFELIFRSRRQTGEIPGDEVLAQQWAAWEARYA